MCSLSVVVRSVFSVSSGKVGVLFELWLDVFSVSCG